MQQSVGSNTYAGGSTGGEGALLSSRASIIGVGCGIGGSLRMAAHFSGVVGYKNTPQRNTFFGVQVPRHREFMIGQKNAIGPMTRYVDDAVLVLKAWWNQSDRRIQQVDPQIPYLPFDDGIYK